MEFNATFIVAFVSFIIFTVIMNLILYKPLSKVVAQRQQFIDENYEEAIKEVPDQNIKPELSFTAKVLIITIVVILIGLIAMIIYSKRNSKKKKRRKRK